MNKVLLTGLGIGKELGVCESCNLNFEELMRNPSTILWADKICLPKNANKPHDEKQYKAIDLFLSMLDEASMIEKIDIAGMYSETMVNSIYINALKDAEEIVKKFPMVAHKGDERVPHEIKIEGYGFCSPRIASIYAAIRVANDIGANCLLQPQDEVFLKYRFGLDAKNQTMQSYPSVYKEIFKAFVPNESILPGYAFGDEEHCTSCIHENRCSDTYLLDFEKKLEEILRWKEYDEIYQIKEVINEIILEKNLVGNQIDVNEIVSEFSNRQKKIRKNIVKRFPKIRRFANLVTIVSSPLAFANVATENTEVAVASAAVTGIAKAVDASLKWYENKNNWVSFYEKNVNKRDLKY